MSFPRHASGDGPNQPLLSITRHPNKKFQDPIAESSKKRVNKNIIHVSGPALSVFLLCILSALMKRRFKLSQFFPSIRHTRLFLRPLIFPSFSFFVFNSLYNLVAVPMHWPTLSALVPVSQTVRQNLQVQAERTSPDKRWGVFITSKPTQASYPFAYP